MSPSGRRRIVARTMLTRDEILARVAAVPHWGQSIPLPHGVVTPGRVMRNLELVRRLGLPEDLSGQRVLDVGTWDGYYAFEAERRGAEVLAIDDLSRRPEGREPPGASERNRGFQTAREILGSKVRFRELSAYDLTPADVGTFDVTLLLGVLYHFRHPLLALEKVASVTRGYALVETAYFRTFSRLPLLRYARRPTVNGDETNWFLFTRQALLGMLADSGFRRTEVLHATPLTPRQVLQSLWVNRGALWRAGWNSNLLGYGRILVKAYR